MVTFSGGSDDESIEKHIADGSVDENALKIWAQNHEKQHGTDGNHVTIRETGKGLSEQEEILIQDIKEKQLGEGRYKLASTESASVSYGKMAAKGDSAYGNHNHNWEASCTCGQRATAADAMKEFIGAGEVKTGVTYESEADKGGKYHRTDLEEMATEYSAPGQGGGVNYH